MRKLIFLLLFIFAAYPIFAQKKDILQAGDWIKEGKNLNKAEQSMMTLLQDSANRQNERIWNTLFEALHKQYEQGNEKLYLNQKYDTASLFNIASRMFTAMESFDSIDSQPDKKGKIRPKYRKENSALLNSLRPNLYNGGTFFIIKHDYDSAYYFFNQYIESAYQPLFKAYNYIVNDKRIPKAAYWAVYCGYKMGDTQKVLHNTYLALKDTSHYENMLQYLAATYKQEKDTVRFIRTLNDGFNRYPLSPFFFPNLIEAYSHIGDWKSALLTANKALKADSTNIVFLLTKSSVFLNTGDYGACFSICDSIINVPNKEKENSIFRVPDEAYLYAGLAKFNLGVALDKNVQYSRRNRKAIMQYYREALPYLEKYRNLQPNAIDKWSLPLYTIYLNLNMGDKFDEIDNIMKKK